MAIADMFLKVQGVTGEAGDADHVDEIEVVSWSWGMQGSTVTPAGEVYARGTMTELEVVKRVDKASPTLMFYLRSNKPVSRAILTVRKAGVNPLEYLKIELESVRVTSIKIETQDAELVERLHLGFVKVRVSYTPQDSTGAVGGGDNVFEADAQEPD